MIFHFEWKPLYCIIDNNYTYQELKPSAHLTDFVHSFFWHQNLTDREQSFIICPDSYFKVIVFLESGQIKVHFLTGLWIKEKEVSIPPNSASFGIRFKLLAPEYVFDKEIASILNGREILNPNFWNIQTTKFDSLAQVTEVFEEIITAEIERINIVPNSKKIALSRLLDHSSGQITVKQVADEVGWSERQIGRYLNKYLGVSLKKYLNILKVYAAYIQIRNGEFFPEEGYYDQAHFIREIKKYTGETPSTLHGKLDDRFIQLKNIKRN